MKQMEVTAKKIGETKFYITPFPAFVAAKLSGELASVLGPILGSFAPMMKGLDANNTDSLMDMNMDEVLPVLADALGQLDGDILEKLMKQLLIDYKNVAYDDEETGETERLTYEAANEVFCGEMQDMFILCWEVIKLNFKGFLKRIAGPSGNLQGITDQVTKKLKTANVNIGTKNGAAST